MTVYLVAAEQSGLAKVGYTTNVEKRLETLRCACPFDLRLVATREGSRRLEKAIHKAADQLRERREWFQFCSELEGIFSQTVEPPFDVPFLYIVEGPGGGMDKPPTLTAFAADAGISVPYACQLLNGTRTPSNKMALRIYERTGRKFGIIANAKPSEIARMQQALSGLQATAA